MDPEEASIPRKRKLRKAQRRRLAEARRQLRRRGGTIRWRDGRPVLVGARPRAVPDVLALRRPVPLAKVFDSPEEEAS